MVAGACQAAAAAAVQAAEMAAVQEVAAANTVLVVLGFVQLLLMLVGVVGVTVWGSVSVWGSVYLLQYCSTWQPA